MPLVEYDASSDSEENEIEMNAKGKVNAEVEKRIKLYKSYQLQGHNFMQNLNSKKEIKNPYLLDKMIQYYEIDEKGSFLHE